MDLALKTRFLELKLKYGTLPSTRTRFLDEETQRLHVYFTSLAARTASLSPSSDLIAGKADELKSLFKGQAQRTGAFISSRFYAAGIDEITELLKSDLKNYANFYKEVTIASYKFRAGFIQKKNSLKSGASSNYTIPVLGIDPEILDMLKKSSHAPDLLLSKLEELFTYSNHDYLHHFTVDWLNNSIAETSNSTLSKIQEEFIQHFDVLTYRLDTYESFMLESHAATFRHALTHDEDFSSGYFSTLDTFFSELELTCGAIMADDKDSKQQMETAGSIVNYFGNAALFSMGRVFHMDEPEMLARATKIGEMDPDKWLKDPVRRAKKRLTRIHALVPEIFDMLEQKMHPGGAGISERGAKLEKTMINCLKEDIDARYKMLDSLREGFNNFEKNASFYSVQDIEERQTYFISELNALGFDLSNLDPKGKSSIEDIEERMEKARVKAHICNARIFFAKLENAQPLDSINYLIDGIISHLSLTGQDLSILDESGTRSVEDIEQAFENAEKKSYLINARNRFIEFEKINIPYISGTIDHRMTAINDLLSRAGKDAAALDTSCTSSAEEMELRLENAYKQTYIGFTRRKFEELKHASYHTDAMVRQIISQIKEDLVKSGADLSVLDPTGQATVEDIEEQLVSIQKNSPPDSEKFFAPSHTERFEYIRDDFPTAFKKKQMSYFREEQSNFILPQRSYTP